jgi:hypothetical protein
MNRAFIAALFTTVVSVTPAFAGEIAPAPEAQPIRIASNVPAPASRGAALPILYASYGALQAFDGFSTLEGIRNGAVEGNSLMTGTVQQPASVWAIKAATAGAAIGVAEKLWRSNRRAQAIVVMVAANSVMATVAARNASVLRNQR